MATAEHKFYSDFARKHYDDGKAKGRSEGVAQALQSRAALGPALARRRSTSSM